MDVAEGSIPSDGTLGLLDPVELDPVEQCVVPDGTGVSGSAAQRFEVGFTSAKQLGLVDRGERNELDRIYFDLSAPDPIAATDLDLGSAPQPERDRHVTG